MKKKLLLTSILTLSLAIGVGAVAFSSENKKEANADTQYEGGVTYLSSVENKVIDTHDDTESEIKSYYDDLNGLSDSDRRGQNLLKHLKPILQNGSCFVNYDNIRYWYLITERDWIQSPLENPGSVFNFEEPTTIKAHVLYRTTNGESNAPDYDTSFTTLNREHLWVKSRGFQAKYETTAPGTDIHHLILADNYINSTSHNNYPYGDAETPTINPSTKKTDTNNIGAKGYRYYDTAEQWWFEPMDFEKGDIARAVLYMAARYNNIAGINMAETTKSGKNVLLSEANLALNNWDKNNYSREAAESLSNTVIDYGDLATLLRWHKLDPVSDFEIHRNNLIDNNFQHNRNPFIDYPEWVDYIWGDSGGYAQPNSDTISQYGKTGAMTITGNNTVVVNDAETLDVNITGITGNDTILWSSSDESVATINSNGVVTGLKEGTTTIKAITKDSTFYAEKEIEVTKNPTISVTGVSLNKSSTTIDVDESETLTANVTPNDATNKNVSWSSSNTNVATVNGGTVTAVAPGSTTITVTTEDGGFTATCQVTVPEPFIPVTGVSLNKNHASIQVGGSETLTATIAPINADNKNVSWSSSDEEVATVSNGTISALKEGSTTITVTTEDGGFTATCEVAVVKTDFPINGPYVLEFTTSASDGTGALDTDSFLGETIVSTNTLVSSISATSKCYNGKQGLKFGTSSLPGSFTANVHSGAQNEIKTITLTSSPWKSSSDVADTGKLVLTVNGNQITNDITPGDDYTYTFDTPTKVTTFSVETSAKRAYLGSVIFAKEGAISVTGVSLNQSALTIDEGESETLTASVSPANATNKNVTWESSAPAVATVDENGTIEAIKAGQTTITVTTEDGGFTATCTVTVKEPGDISHIQELLPVCASLNNGQATTESYTFKGTVTGVYGKSFFIQEGSYGMYVYNYTDTTTLGITKNQVVQVTSKLKKYNNQYEAVDVSACEILDETPEQIVPIVVNSYSEITNDMQNALITIKGLTYKSGDYNPTSTSSIYFNFKSDSIVYRTNTSVAESDKTNIETKITDAKTAVRVDLVGVHCVAYNSYFQINICSANSINTYTNKQLVQLFVDEYMHMNDYDPTLSGDGDNSCLGENGYYRKAKTALTDMSDEQINIFRTDGDFANAKARYEAWAEANKDSTPYEKDLTPSNLLKTIDRGDAFVTTIIIISSLSAMALMFALVLKKKKYE